MFRHFTFTEGTSNKFWHVEIDGTNMITSYGRIGTAGQETIKTFPTMADAVTAAEKLIKQKVKKGYVEELDE